MKASILLIVCIFLAQSTTAKKKVTTMEKATSAVSTLFENVQEFFEDILDTITDFMMGPKSTKTGDWAYDFMKYTKNTLKSGYTTLRNMIPVLDMARSAMEDVHFLLPNVTTTQFIESLLTQLVPDLIKTNHSSVVKN